MLLAAVGVLLAAAVTGLVLLRPTEPLPQTTAPAGDLVDARILDVEVLGEDAAVSTFLPGAVEVSLTVRLDATGEVVEFVTTDDTGGGTFAAGQRVRLAVLEAAGQDPTYLVADFRRDRPLLLLALLFVIAVVAFGRAGGVRALLGLAVTFAVILLFVVPAIAGGRDPVAVALAGGVLVSVVTLYVSHGFSDKTTAAVVGTGVALAVTALLAAVFVAAAQLTGFASEDAVLANVQVGGLNLRGLLLAGIILGALGVLDDVTIAQAATVVELHRADPTLTRRDVAARALRVGRDHIAATVNTLFLAYAGAALPLLLLFATGTDPVTVVLTSEVVATEVVRTLVGSLGLLTAVPATTALASLVVVPAAARDGGEGDAGGPEGGADPGVADPDDEPWEAELRARYGLDHRQA